MGINVKHTPGAGVFAVPAYLAGQEDLRRHMEKMDQQRVELMLKAQQAREENAVKIAMQDAQINAQANSQRAGQMHDFQRMQFGAGLNAAQDKVNFDQQQAIQQKGIDAQVALQAAQQKAIADRMKEDDERAKVERERQEKLAAEQKAAADKKLEQDRINQASAAEDTRTIDAVAKAANPQEKAAALDIIRKEAESKTAQQIAREALLQTHEFSAEQQEAMKKANEQIKKIDAATLTPQQKFDMQKPHREVLDNMMPSARRKSLQEQIEYGPNGEQITRDKSGAIVVKPPVKLHDVDKMFAQQREWFDSNVKAGMSPAEAEAAARAKMQEYQNLIRMDAEVRQRVQKGENEIDVRAELEQKYRSVAPVPQAPTTPTTPTLSGVDVSSATTTSRLPGMTTEQVDKLRGTTPTTPTLSGVDVSSATTTSRLPGMTTEQVDKLRGTTPTTPTLSGVDVSSATTTSRLPGMTTEQVDKLRGTTPTTPTLSGVDVSSATTTSRLPGMTTEQVDKLRGTTPTTPTLSGVDVSSATTTSRLPGMTTEQVDKLRSATGQAPVATQSVQPPQVQPQLSPVEQVKANNQHDQQAYAARERQLREAGASQESVKVQMRQWQESRDTNYRKTVDALKGVEKLLSPRDGDFRPAPYELQRQGVVGEIPAGRGPMQLRQYNTQGIPIVVDAKGLEPGTLYAVVENGKIAYKRKGVTKETLQPTPQ